MTVLSRRICAALLAGGLAAPALAAGVDAPAGAAPGAATSGDAPSASGPGGERGALNDAAVGTGGVAVMRRLRGDLVNAGFTDIRILPSSFLVRAKDPSGNPVMMLLNPDPVAATGGENAGAVGASSPNSAGATPGPKSTGGAQPATPGGAETP